MNARVSDGRLPVRRRWIGWTVGVLLSLLLIAIGWVCIRGIGAVNDVTLGVFDTHTKFYNKTVYNATDYELAETALRILGIHADPTARDAAHNMEAVAA